jgi:hypothetical protein
MYIAGYIGERCTIGDATKLYEKVILTRSTNTYQFTAADRSGHVHVTTAGRTYEFTCDLTPPKIVEQTLYSFQWERLLKARKVVQPSLADCMTFQLKEAQMRRQGNAPLEIAIFDRGTVYELQARIGGTDQLQIVRAIDKALEGRLGLP